VSEILLRVSDDGVGFEPEKVRRTVGLGFIRMKEQLQLIGGELAVRSKPAFGTQIEARAPLGEFLKELGVVEKGNRAYNAICREDKIESGDVCAGRVVAPLRYPRPTNTGNGIRNSDRPRTQH
jgi:hypothetical protein